MCRKINPFVPNATFLYLPPPPKPRPLPENIKKPYGALETNGLKVCHYYSWKRNYQYV